MLTSSDAKWRCLWHMLVWSINLSLVAQFLHITSHVAFYIIAAISILVLPALTAVYSNTSGRHGAGLLRAGLVFCDPVLACITVTPSIMLNQLPGLVDEYACLRLHTSWNSTLECVLNHTDIQDKDWYVSHAGDSEPMRQLITIDKKQRYLIIEGAIVTPILLALLMCKRTRKMHYNTFLISCAYWLVLAVEAVSLLENVLLEDVHKHIVYTTEAMISVVVILSASYAVITLLSYLSPVAPNDYIESETEHDKFDFLYRAFVGTASILFCEIPLIVARFRMLALDTHRLLPGTFYVWLIKDCVFVFMILVLVYGQRFGHKYLRLPCKSFDSETAFHFEPEKRDRYIHQHQKDTKTFAITKKNDKVKKMEPATVSVAAETKDVKKDKKASKTDKSKKEAGILKNEKDAVQDVRKKDHNRSAAMADHSTPKKGTPKDVKSKKSDIAMQDLSPIKAHHSPQKPASRQSLSSPKKRTSSVNWSSNSDDSDDYLELDKRKQITEEELARRKRKQKEEKKTSDRMPKKGQKSSEESPKIQRQQGKEGNKHKEKGNGVGNNVESPKKKVLKCKEGSPTRRDHNEKGNGEGNSLESPKEKGLKSLGSPTRRDNKEKGNGSESPKEKGLRYKEGSPSRKDHKAESPKEDRTSLESLVDNVEDEIPKKKMRKSGEESPKKKGSEDNPKKETRRVMFQFDIGEGKAIAIKSRSDSPGVIIDSPEGSNVSEEV